MSEKILKGRGRLYSSDAQRILIDITYEIQENPEWTGTQSGWSGQCTTSTNIAPGKCILQLQDGRKGACTVKPKIMSIGGGTVYSIQGVGKLA